MEDLKWRDTVHPQVDMEQMFLSTTRYKEVTRQLRAKWFKDLFKYCGIHDTAHTFRAVAALDMLNSGMSLIDMKIRVGWATSSHTVDTFKDNIEMSPDPVAQ
ncbi:hypothetical protein GGI24_004471 [Coemansia furcata]|nr:hypothetical protein GGI24_004471 [Coemansia furcata]